MVFSLFAYCNFSNIAYKHQCLFQGNSSFKRCTDNYHVTRKGVSFVIRFVQDLSWIHNACQAVEHNVKVHTRGSDSIETVLERNHTMASVLGKSHSELNSIPVEMKDWISILKRKYVIKQGGKKPRQISNDDVKKLQSMAQNWITRLRNFYSKGGLVLLNESSTSDIISDYHQKKLKKIAQEDLKEGIQCVKHLLPTPATIMLFRVGESLLQDYYFKIMKKKHGRKTRGTMIDDLEKTNKVSKSLLGYFYYLNDKRIDGAHPKKRFEQEECERILINIKDLLEAMFPIKTKSSKK